MIQRKLMLIGTVSLAGLLGGCVLAPRGTDAEKERLAAAGVAFETPFERRTLPELPAEPNWRDVLHRAFLANGDLEASYFQWKAAMARIDMAAAWPNTNLSLTFQYMFSSEKMKSWDRTTVIAQPDTMANLTAPIKARQAGKVAFEEARAAGMQFSAKKFEIQRQVLTSYLDYALMAEQVRIGGDNVALLKMLSETAATRVRGGAPQQDLLKAQIEYRLAENELSSMQSRLEGMRAMLNGMLARPADAPLPPPKALPAARLVGADDARLIAIATDANPELSALARNVAGRKEALELARMAYIPDINPMAGFTGNVSQMLGAMISVPTTIPMIQGQINESRAMLRMNEAMLRQTKNDRGAAFVAALYAMRNAERQQQVFQGIILPKAEQVMRSSREAYAAGSINLIELIDSQRTLLQVRQMIAETRIEREKRLVELEALAGVDIETLSDPTTGPATQPKNGQNNE
jgi:cobalt-zinc-cadmium efflux system outer membrane protein